MAAYSTSVKASWLMCLGLLLLALLAPQHAEAHGAMLYPPPRGGVGTKSFNWRIHTFIDYKGFKFPCGGYNKPGPVTKMRAGEVIPVRFWTAGMNDKRDEKRLPTKKISQARHGGGLCEFSLSYDGGRSYHVIGAYTKTCPDIYYEWKVRIPKNVPSCKERGQCLFAFSWTASLVPQFYHNCADVEIDGVKNGKLPSKMMQKYDFKGKGIRRGVTFPGDGKSHERGIGPNKREEQRNLRG